MLEKITRAGRIREKHFSPALGKGLQPGASRSELGSSGGILASQSQQLDPSLPSPRSRPSRLSQFEIDKRMFKLSSGRQWSLSVLDKAVPADFF